MSVPGPEESDDQERTEVPDQIRCVECGGIAYRLPFQPDEGWEPGDVVTYRCGDCAERWDVEV